MKSLIFLLFITFVSSDVIQKPKIIQKGLINRNVCIGGKIENGICKCPNETALIGYNCKPCIGGTIILNRCKCSSGRYLFGNECILIPKFTPGRISLRGLGQYIYQQNQ